jgi:hypothetical protein
MEVKNLFDTTIKLEIINRIDKLTPDSKAVWGKMNVAQMLAHVQKPIGIALGTHQPKGSFLLRLIDPTFITTGTIKDFEKEKAVLLELVNRFTEENITKDQHPIFGKLTKENWSKATWKHLDHHLKQFGV